MKNKRISDVVLVYDRYYSKKPNMTVLIAERVGLCCAICLCAMMFVLTEYDFPVSKLLCGVLVTLFGAAFSLLFVFVKKRFAIPGLLLLFGAVVWLRRESFIEKISYFFDEMCMLLDGRFVSGSILVSHRIYELTDDNELYIKGVLLGTVLLMALFAMITAAGMFSKPRYLPSFLFWILLWVPTFISERFTFNFWIIPALAVYMGAFAVSITYKQGLALKAGKNGIYRSSAVLSESNFKNSLAKVPYAKRIGMLTTHYSKYFSVSIYAVLIFTVIGIFSSVLFYNTKGIDYTSFYEFIISLGERSSVNPPFERSPIEDYFTTPKNTTHLGITSPGTSEMEILKVTNPGNCPVYLRGDYGIGFYGNHWTSPVNNSPAAWKGLEGNYRPAEVRVLQNLLLNADTDNDMVESIDLTVDYLCDSKTVFLPAYTENFNYYENSMFNTYGDFVVRVNERYNKVKNIECTAMIPGYTNQDGSATAETFKCLTESINAVYKWDFEEIMNRIMPGGSLAEYKSYVYSTFLASPTDGDLTAALDDFLTSFGFFDMEDHYRADWELSELEIRYRIADALCGYLRDNYTYSLSNENTGSDAVRSFLTETKRGHCALYATSMTLLLRRMGIPARYATGFVAPPSGNVPTILRSKNLHAWCEVYMDELGWVTFDPTSSAALGDISTPPPGYSSDSRSSDHSSESSSGSGDYSSSESSSSREDSSSHDSSSEDESGDTTHESVIDSGNDNDSKLNFLPYLFIILIIAAVVVLAVLIVRGYRALENKAVRTIRRCCRERKAKVIFEKVITLLEVGGLTPKPGELPDKFYMRAEKTLRCAFSVNKDMLEAVAFGNIAVHETDCEGLARLLEQLYNALDKKLDVFDRIKLWRAVL